MTLEHSQCCVTITTIYFQSFFFNHPKQRLYPLNNDSLFPKPPAPDNFCSTFCSYEFTNSQSYTIEIMQCPFISGLFSMMSLKFIHVVACVRISFL